MPDVPTAQGQTEPRAPKPALATFGVTGGGGIGSAALGGALMVAQADPFRLGPFLALMGVALFGFATAYLTASRPDVHTGLDFFDRKGS